MVIFIFGDGPDVSRIARNLLFGIDKLTITNSLNFGGFWTFSIFSWFFRHVQKVVEIFFPPKKVEILVLATETFLRGLLRL